jgi:Icc-related predicted phosphoesterase
VILVSDVHGEFDALVPLAQSGEELLILGDLINLLDYRTREGIIADVLGPDFGAQVAGHRASGDYEAMRRAWFAMVGERREEVRAEIEVLIRSEYLRCREALSGGHGYVTFGNVDRPDLLAASLPDGMRFVDGVTVEIEGVTVGFAGGGVSTPVGASGEVSDEEMAAKLERLGPVDVLCTHLPPAIDPLRTDVITGRSERSSVPIRDYLSRWRPRWHFFGDVHQPQAITWRVGSTACRNVGYFRATRRPVRFHPTPNARES